MPELTRQQARPIDELRAEVDCPERELEESCRAGKTREHLRQFLDGPDAVETTNILAACELRAAVIARKLSAGNRTEGVRRRMPCRPDVSAGS